MRQRLINTKTIFSVCTFVLLATAIQAQEFSSPPSNMPFRYGLGHEQYQEHCAKCHGGSLKGSDEGPPLLHGYYKPSHHNDTAFYRAIRRGSKQHHWNFGDMPAVDGIAENEARAIIEFVRWFQRESDLF